MRRIVALLIASWIVGIVCGAFAAPSFFVILLLGVASIFAYRLHVKLHSAVAASLLFLLGALYGTQSLHASLKECAPSEAVTATLERTVSLAATGARYVFVRDDGCKLLVYAPRFPVLVRGAIANIAGKQTRPMEEFAGIPEYAAYLIDNGISLVVRNANVSVVQEGRAGLDMFRIRIVSQIGTLFREPDASLITAMVIGDQGMISQDIKDIYRKSGITHILSISGLHVSVIAIVLTFGIGLLRVPPLVRSALIFLFLWVYIVGVGSPPAAVRAGVFWTCFVLAYHIRALMGLLTVVLLTLAVLLTHSPGLVRSIGFELSVVAICGIGVAIFFLRNVRFSPWAQGAVMLLGASAGATITTAPLTLYYFGNFSIVGLITNMLVVPLLPCVTYLVLLALFLQPFLPVIALVCSFVVHILMSWILFVATICARVPYGNFSGVAFPLWGVFVYYGLLVLGIIWCMRRFRISWREWWV